MKTIAAADLPAMLRPGMKVFVGGSSNEPLALVEALGQQPEAADGIRFVQFPLPGLNRTDFSALRESAAMTTFFLTPDLHAGYAAGRVRFLPMHMRNVFDYLQEADLDMALMQVGTSADGQLRVGPNADFFAAATTARTVVAQLNRSFVAPAGAPPVDPDDIDYLIESDRPLPTLAPPTIDDTTRVIGSHVASLIQDGDCIQTGIGAIPAAILAALSDKNDLGLHGGLIDDGGMALIASGVATGQAKSYLPGRHVAGMALGSSRLFDWIAERPDVVLAGADVTHDVRVLAGIDNFVSINSAVEVDLLGQVNAEVVGNRQISGTGGAVDFMRGARLAKGGRSIVAMTATARAGSQSRIVERVAVATALRTDVDIVVTEYGIAKLHGVAEAARRQALVDVAHPRFRDQLARAATRPEAG